MVSFDTLNLSENLLKNIKNQGYESTYPIQAQAIPTILSGKDLLGIAKTGSGKTASFVLPILEKLQHRTVEKSRNIQLLILVPTRELAIQIQSVLTDFKIGLKRDIKTLAVYGGVSINPQMKSMLGVEILIATPGRLLDLIDHNALSLSETGILVVDEADKMFQLGFEAEMDKIIQLLPSKRQNILFSATLNDKVVEMKSKLKIDPITIEIVDSSEETEEIQLEEFAYAVTPETKGPFLRYLIKSTPMNQVLVFVSSTRTADNLATKLKKNGIRTSAIHGDKTQGSRLQALDDFKNNRITVLIATDLISRGIHIEGLPYVVNFELPRSPIDYIHRIGRTGRADAKGTAISLITPADEHHFKIIKKKAKKWIPVENTDSVNLHGY